VDEKEKNSECVIFTMQHYASTVYADVVSVCH